MKAKMELAESVTRTEALRRSLEAMIVKGELAPGARLDEVELADRFKVSRTPVREALHALAASGLVEMRSRQGAIVSMISIATLLDMFQMMAGLEGLCASFAARRATLPQRQKIHDTHLTMVKVFESGDPEAFYEANREFHEAVYAAANSEFVAEQTLALRNRVSPYRRHVTFQPGRMAATIGEHERVLNAIAAANGPEAHAAMADHVSLLGDNLIDFIAAIPTQSLKMA